MKRKRNVEPPSFRIGIVNGYSVQIAKIDLPDWEQKGFVNTGGRPILVPIPVENIWVWGVPTTLSDSGVERLLNREIIGFSSKLGSYGMGGHGFFGIQLATSSAEAPTEYLVLPISRGIRFVRIDESRPDKESLAQLIGSIIHTVHLSERQCILTLKKDREEYLMTLFMDSPSPDDPHYHPEYYADGSIADYLIFQGQKGVLVS